YLPATQRIGSKEIVLFDLFNINFVWALSTPDEFCETLFPLLMEEQKKLCLQCETDTQADGTELLNILPRATACSLEKSAQTGSSAPGGLPENEQGVVLFFKGAVAVGAVGLNIALGTVLAESTGFATGVEFNAKIANVFRLHLWGALGVNLEPGKEEVRLAGTSSLKLWDKTVMEGSFKLAASANPSIEFSGLLDLFPDDKSPVKFYTGEQKGKKSPITGRIDKTSILYTGGLHLEIGGFYLGGHTSLLVNGQQNQWISTLKCNDTTMTLLAAMDSEFLVLAGEVDSPIKIGNDITISAASSTTKGPSTTLKFKNTNGLPAFESFRFDGGITIFGNSSKTLIEISSNKFLLETKTKFLSIDSSLTVSGSSLTDIATYKFSGTLDLSEFNCFIEGLLDPFQTKNKSKLDKIRNDVSKYNDKKQKTDYIKNLDEKYNKPGYDGYNYIVPPLSHISYWVNLTYGQNFAQRFGYDVFAPYPRWNQHDVDEVKQYWDYMKDIGGDCSPPQRYDLGRWINGTFNAIVKDVNALENKILEDIRKTANDFNQLFKALHIDTKLSNDINKDFNAIISTTETLNDKIAKCIKEKEMLVKIEEIKFKDLSIATLKSNNFTAYVKYDFLGETKILENGNIDLKNPSELMKTLCDKVLAL
ncbi:MAG TPA: hypothetical protein VN611_04975, partial [Patescibacteria group bacterium]|nr:hypothetical protein [Patescibacteria group bacterium]